MSMQEKKVNMALVKKDLKALEEANALYLSGKYFQAMQKYNQLLVKYPFDEELKLYILLCDIASENEEKSNMLFDYFTIEKKEDKNNAIESITTMIKAYDGDIEEISRLVKEISTMAVESLEAVDYKDFLELVKSRGSFKEAYEDIMFSTKVAITSKEEFFDFVNKLIDNDFRSSAYSYLDGFNEYFAYDSKIQELYKKLEEKNGSANNNK
jgi:tetratricopeptide (TPR) repeat protein